MILPIGLWYNSMWYLDAPPKKKWNPAKLSNLAIWLRAKDLSTLFQNSGGTTPVTANGDPVGFWGDKSLSNLDFIQATIGLRPIYRSAGINSRPSVEGDGIGMFLSTTPSFGASDWTCSVVIKPTNTVAILESVFGCRDAELAFFPKSIESITTAQLGYVYPGGVQEPGNVASTTAAQVLTWVLSAGAGGSIYRNAVLVGSGGSYDATSLNAATGVFSAAHAAYGFFTGQIGEIVLYDRALSGGELTTLINYMKNEYGIS